MMPSVVAAVHAADIAVFAVAAVLVIAGAFGVVLSRSPIHAALSLVVTLFGVAVLFVAQEAHFLAAVQVIVYAGAIVVLFLFVIMLLGVARPERIQRDPIPAQRPLAVLLGLVTLGLVIALAKWSWTATGQPSQGGVADGRGSNVGKLADSIFTQYLFPFEATSLLLVLAVVGAVVLVRRGPAEAADSIDEEGGDTADAPAPAGPSIPDAGPVGEAV